MSFTNHLLQAVRALTELPWSKLDFARPGPGDSSLEIDGCACLHCLSKEQANAELQQPWPGSLLLDYSRYKFGCLETTRSFALSMAKRIRHTLTRLDLMPDECILMVPPARDLLLRSPVTKLGELVGSSLDIPCVSPVFEEGRLTRICYSGLEDTTQRMQLRSEQFERFPPVDGSLLHWFLIDDCRNTGSTLRALQKQLETTCGVQAVSQFALIKIDLETPGQEHDVNRLILKHLGLDKTAEIIKSATQLTGTAIRSIFENPELLERCCDELSLRKLILLYNAGYTLSINSDPAIQEKTSRVLSVVKEKIAQAVRSSP